MKHKITIKRTLIAAAALIITMCITVGDVNVMAAAYLTTTVVNMNSAPVAENLELETYRGIPVDGTFRSLDPEGDLVTYSVTQDPKKGTVTVDGDNFTYTPSDNKKGKDTFNYVAIDSTGNISNEATVTVNIKKQTTSITYSDMEGNSAWYAATYLAENGIFVGEKVGNDYLFSPDAAITRGEFLAMCLELCGTETVDGIIRTGFYDDSDIPDWQKSYVTTAVVNNIVRGYSDNDGKIVFSPNDTVTFAQATVMLNNTLDVTDVSYEESEAYPSWAGQAVANLASCDIISFNDDGISASGMTRADAAEMLLGAAKLLDERNSSFSLLSWAK